MKKITSKEELKAFLEMPKLRVYDNFNQTHNNSPEEDCWECLEISPLISSDFDLYELPNDYYLTVSNYDGVVKMYRKIKMFNSISEIKQLIDSRMHLSARLTVSYHDINAKYLFINNSKVALPIAENELNKIMQSEIWKSYHVEKH